MIGRAYATRAAYPPRKNLVYQGANQLVRKNTEPLVGRQLLLDCTQVVSLIGEGDSGSAWNVNFNNGNSNWNNQTNNNYVRCVR